MIIQDGTILRLEGHCSVEEAEILLENLQKHPITMLDAGRCTGMHTAVLQLTRVSGLPVVALLASLLFTE